MVVFTRVEIFAFFLLKMGRFIPGQPPRKGVGRSPPKKIFLAVSHGLTKGVVGASLGTFCSMGEKNFIPWVKIFSGCAKRGQKFFFNTTLGGEAAEKVLSYSPTIPPPNFAKNGPNI